MFASPYQFYATENVGSGAGSLDLNITTKHFRFLESPEFNQPVAFLF